MAAPLEMLCISVYHKGFQHSITTFFVVVLCAFLAALVSLSPFSFLLDFIPFWLKILHGTILCVCCLAPWPMIKKCNVHILSSPHQVPPWCFVCLYPLVIKKYPYWAPVPILHWVPNDCIIIIIHHNEGWGINKWPGNQSQSATNSSCLICYNKFQEI